MTGLWLPWFLPRGVQIPRGRNYGNSPHSWGFNTIWKNELRELSDTEFLLLQTSECRQSKPAGMNCPASQGDEPRRGGGGLTPTGA